MIQQALSVACWVGWALLLVGSFRVGWWAVMYF